MWRIRKRVSRNYSDGDNHQNTIYRLIFGLAMACGIDAQKLAKYYSKNKTDRYAKNFNKALEKRIEEQKSKEEKVKKDLQ